MGLLDDLGAMFGAASSSPTYSASPVDGMPMLGGASQSLSLPQGGTAAAAMGAPSQGFNLAGTVLSGLGRSLMTSPSNNPLQNFSAGLDASAKASGLSRSQDALIQRLKAMGFPEDQARQIAGNPSMAQSLFGNVSMTGPAGEPVPSMPPTMPLKLGINS